MGQKRRHPSSDAVDDRPGSSRSHRDTSRDSDFFERSRASPERKDRQVSAPVEDDEVDVEIVDGVKRVNGDASFQVQVYIPREGTRHMLKPGQKVPKVCIRGPSRGSRDVAEEDARRLRAAFHDGGVTELRKVRAALTGRGGQ